MHSAGQFPTCYSFSTLLLCSYLPNYQPTFHPGWTAIPEAKQCSVLKSNSRQQQHNSAFPLLLFADCPCVPVGLPVADGHLSAHTFGKLVDGTFLYMMLVCAVLVNAKPLLAKTHHHCACFVYCSIIIDRPVLIVKNIILCNIVMSWLWV